FLGPSKDLMGKLSYEEQLSVLLHGSDLLEAWTGRRPVAHRSGGYSIDQNTVRALVSAGIPLDSSMNCEHSNSKLVWARNRIVEADGIVELPVTVADFVIDVRLGGYSSRVRSRRVKTDLNAFMLEDFHAYIRD